MIFGNNDSATAFGSIPLHGGAALLSELYRVKREWGLGSRDLIIWILRNCESGEYEKGYCSKLCDNTSLFGNDDSVLII